VFDAKLDPETMQQCQQDASATPRLLTITNRQLSHTHLRLLTGVKRISNVRYSKLAARMADFSG
jgi:hypothetical protein